jgi:hypothetical protein
LGSMVCCPPPCSWPGDSCYLCTASPVRKLELRHSSGCPYAVGQPIPSMTNSHGIEICSFISSGKWLFKAQIVTGYRMFGRPDIQCIPIIGNIFFEVIGSKMS